ncbi:MAG: HAD family hydrolase [Pyrinomonadaceae bacterium]
MIKAILMDFNGVIIDDEPIQMKAYQEILKNESIELTEEDYYKSLGMDDETFVENAYSRAGKKPETNKVLEITQAKTNRWREMIADELPIFPGVENFIRKMEKDFALGVVSMARREEIEFVLEKADLKDCFSIIVSAEDVTACKPDPQCYIKGFNLIDAARMRVGKNPMVHGDCLVIEDSPPGIAAGNRAGLKTLGVTNTVDARALREAGADSVTKYLDDWMPASLREVFV